MSFTSIKNVFAQAALASPDEFSQWLNAWRVAAENGSPEPLLAFFSRERGLSEEQFLQQLGQALGWPFLELPKLTVPSETRQRISTKVAFQYTVLPTHFENGALQVAVGNPFDAAMLNAVQFDAQCPVQFALAPRGEIEKALKKYYGVGAETLDEMSKDEPLDLLVGEDKEITERDQEASVIKFVNQVIWEAHKDRATDIHFEPAEDELRIRYRIDGILHQTPMPPQLKRYQAALISRIKVMSGMNIAEKRLPQDGRINVRIKGEEIDIRVSTVPTVYGESVSLGLRHILRQDPNVIMVGEIRDLETAEIAIRASLTGHLVFSTLHTNDAPSAFTRLIDMGIEPFLVASSVEAVMAQRLIRTICPHCKTERKVERDYLRKIGFPEDEIM